MIAQKKIHAPGMMSDQFRIRFKMFPKVELTKFGGQKLAALKITFNFVNSTLGKHFKPNPEFIGHNPRSGNLFLGDHKYFCEKKFKNRFFR